MNFNHKMFYLACLCSLVFLSGIPSAPKKSRKRLLLIAVICPTTVWLVFNDTIDYARIVLPLAERPFTTLLLAGIMFFLLPKPYNQVCALLGAGFTAYVALFNFAISRPNTIPRAIDNLGKEVASGDSTGHYLLLLCGVLGLIATASHAWKKPEGSSQKKTRQQQNNRRTSEK